jgi:hypothetical protein
MMLCHMEVLSMAPPAGQTLVKVWFKIWI